MWPNEKGPVQSGVIPLYQPSSQAAILSASFPPSPSVAYPGIHDAMSRQNLISFEGSSRWKKGYNDERNVANLVTQSAPQKIFFLCGAFQDDTSTRCFSF
jgi:hypothetical protein